MKVWHLDDDEERWAFFDDIGRTEGKMKLDMIPLAIDVDAPLFKALGLPEPERIFRLWYHGAKWGAQYSNFVVEMVGIEERDIPSGGLRSTIMMEYTNKTAGVAYNINLWRRRVMDRDSQIIIRQIYNPLTDLKAPLTLALGGAQWVTTISRINANLPDGDKEIRDAQRVARGLEILIKATSDKIEERKILIVESVERYAQAQTANGRQPEKWTFRHFAKHWHWRIASNNLYKLLPEPERREAKALYDKRCTEITRARNEAEGV